MSDLGAPPAAQTRQPEPLPWTRISAWPAWTGPLPGIALTFTIATLAFILRFIPGVSTFSALILAILIGI
ncbi:MAG: YeiH family putative sulfate export transporter, partial [Hyphomicrobiales bacterium]